MENNREGPYSVLTRDQLKGNMKKQIAEISEIFSLSKPDATVLLMFLRWDSHEVSEFLVENNEKVLSESGLKPVVVDPNQDLYKISSCGICFKTCDDGDYLISTPFCSHMFCKSCWRKYLEKNFYLVEKTQTRISCPHGACQAAVGPDTIQKLTVCDQEMYVEYILRSYIEGNKVLEIKYCPAQDCNYVIEFHQKNHDGADQEDYGFNVVCLCGHIFCWRCMLESHKPVTCNNASDWLFRDLNSLSKESGEKPLSLSSFETREKTYPLSSIKATKKVCPHCLRPADLGTKQYLRFLTCACNGRFCWKCMQPEEAHKTESGFYKFCNVSMTFEGRAPKTLEGRAEPENSCVGLWKASEVSLKQAKSDLQAFEESNIKNPSDLTEKDFTIIRKGLMLIVQCRQVLKWSCVYDYLHAEYEMSKREYLRFLQADATSLVESFSKTLNEEIGRASSATYENFCCVKHKVTIETSNIGNYFYHFIKTLQEGLDDVKVKSYDDYGGLFWLCDRCTYGNTWFHKECLMCSDDIAARVDLSDMSLN
ncbi:ARI-like RING zinc finger protein-like [Arabidopsis thaliana]|uniref:Probable E3 ubiquitin-protein ligase ARI13 n=2 Tax=Arabidopsis thaliana TaxID=3702 RepID=ARI13_ARATH|nr:RING/U-box superfamily protein [Arabidopsis thaliana]Q9FFN9.1 RecName: Full=Probable E3 ubiquitin-protein ligase ARI13; AltName: Full=ARIADNE-like protein ARI13; AltName: Full=Protein ariadne homolog 13; AltName: Full=RING-type E3 ubiquitin transferase ARI13 [Arabidopsis thaliana]AED97792.1 RING/U-box superfamily protein [Arabidopsis thaliana]CAA0411802.1 unnamed protein product [Arabidopsis thaliana]CAD52895.1 ARIADNE-like protein ARI13 [Arabidopsis thaliana]VYS71312.1 unnamed protein prod|eukprot:NP_201180.1 RING/U-box superfamily protein [Arabidopsis thaliana]